MDIRAVPEAHIDRALELAYLVFHHRPDEARRKHYAQLMLDCERIGAYDGDVLVGFAAAFRFTLSVPGGELPCPGLTFVCVAPTHRRRGVLTAMLRELFARCTGQGAPVTALWASEDVIYGRFGFGTATQGLTLEVDSRRPLALRVEPDERPLRLVDPADAPALLGPYYERTRAERAGRIARGASWWADEWLVEEDEDDDELSPPRVVVLGDPVAGYAVYRTKGEDEDAHRPGLVRVDDLEADGPREAAALWRYLASIDLTGLVRAWGVPLDEPLLRFAGDRDQVRITSCFPALRLRLVDVAAALTARSWAAEADLVLEVRDAHVPANAGRFRLLASPGGATYGPTDAAADLVLDVRDLGECYLGGSEVGALVAAGVVEERTKGAARALDEALRTPRLPHTVDAF
ncbi:GNAT family N-acetyltransferase [Streptomyces sp. NPDC001941]|uniref:GNAT family N-acetyltransferase n=1 Tax=Streptomyces sp. NPDC001941 TaxID=3154659 RepID=UPI003320A244